MHRSTSTPFFSQYFLPIQPSVYKLVRAAAKLIKEHIKAIKTSHEIYSSGDYLESQEANMKYPPDTLLALIEGMFAGKNSGVKGASIGQAIMQATRPRFMLAHCSSGCACSCITTSHPDSSLTLFIITDCVAHTNMYTRLNEMSPIHTEQTSQI